MLERHDIEHGPENARAKRQRGEVGQRLNARIVPGGIADSQVDRRVLVTREITGMARLASPGVQHTRTRRNGGRKIPYCTFQNGIEMKQMAMEPTGQPALHMRVNHRGFLRASTIMLLPARQAASSMVKGKQATVKPK